MPDLKGYEIMIASTDGSFSVIGVLGTVPAKITDGYGGWEIVSRPRREGLTEWRGRNPFQMEISLMFDGWFEEESQEPKIKRLTWMSLPRKKKEGGVVKHLPPSPVNLYGSLPFPSGGQWLVNNIEWGDNVIWKAFPIFDKKHVQIGATDPIRVRQDCTVTLLEYIDSGRVQLLRGGTGLRPPHPKRWTVKKGEKLSTLAQRFYGDYNLWWKIARANGIRDPHKVKPGRTLKIPD